MIQPYEVGEPLLQVQNVSLKFGDKLILRDVNATVRRVHRPPPVTQGQVIGFLGPSGIGKTQLSKILAGLHTPTTGKVLIKDNIPVHAGMVGYVEQDYFLRRNRTVMGNLMLAAKRKGDKATASERVEQYCEMFELSPFVKSYPAQLSGGQRQRVAIAQQLLCSDHYLIMDEPFSGLDINVKERVCQRIIDVSLTDETEIIVVISHDIRCVLGVADVIWLLGRDKDAAGNVIPGSYIRYTHDLMAEGLCWNPDILRTPEFDAFASQVEAEFRTL